MQDVSILIGSVALRDFEVPGRVIFGGKQSLAIHQLIGGGRVVDSLGRDDRTISFSGTFSGQDATLRARLIDAMRVGGQPVPLIWDVFYYTVVIAELEIDYTNAWWIPFRIAFAVVADEAASPVQQVVSLLDSLLSDTATAATFATQGGYDLSAAQAALSTPNASTLGSAAYAASLAAFDGASLGVASARDAAGLAMERSASAATGASPASLSSLAKAASAAGQCALLANAGAFLGRAQANLLDAST